MAISSAHTSLNAEQIKALDSDVKHQIQVDFYNITQHLSESHDAKKRPYIMLVLFRGGDTKEYSNYSLSAIEVAVHKRYLKSKHDLGEAFIWDGLPLAELRQCLKIFNSYH